MATINQWYLGARPKTLPAALAPVIAACGLAVGNREFVFSRAVLALGVALALQVGTNYANDYSDGVKGTDSERVGPMRLVASGAAEAKSVKIAAYLSFLVAALLGLILALLTTPWLIALGAASILAGWFYTGGPKPYGYYGFGELFVFVFFGLVATMGTYYVQAGDVTFDSLLLACEMGLMSVAILVVNNLRDIEGDRLANKKTLAVRLGDGPTRRFYQSCLVLSLLLMLALGARFHLVLLGWILIVPLAVSLITKINQGGVGRELLPLLAQTSRLLLIQGVVVAVCLGIAVVG
jgi:1,4-dihydroxy-2-naphthoate octaprenyltransferase